VVEEVLVQRTDDDVIVLSDEDYAILDERQFGMPGLRATESIGPFVEVQASGPLIMVHDALVEAHLGIGHHPHRFNERLFYILRGELDHDDALNGITGHMGPGDLARLTEGRRGMYHKEWNNGDEQTRAFILVYGTDPVPPQASFTALRDAEAPRYDEAEGVRTKELLGPRSPLEVHGDIRGYTDSTFDSEASAELRLAVEEGGMLVPLAGSFAVGQLTLEEGQIALVPSEPRDRTVSVTSLSGGRLLRIVHGPGHGFVTATSNR
jgi:redox-sensitive bicupin YhaK (pirin superfamily)